MGKYNKDDYKKAEKMTEKEMLDSAERGRRWSNTGDFWDDFKGKFQDNLWVVKYGWIVVAVIIVVVIISSSNKPQPKGCDHNIDNASYSINYSLEFWGSNSVLTGSCNSCGKNFTIYAESSEVISHEEPKCESPHVYRYLVTFKLYDTIAEMTYSTTSGIALGHEKPDQLIEEYLPATCEHEGHYETYDCTRCGKRINGTIISKLDHTVVVDDVQIEPTCLAAGRTPGSYCSVCGTTITGYESIPIVPCSYDSVVTEPTYTTMGFTTHTCKWCNDVYQDEFKHALVYDYVNLATIEGRESEGLFITSMAAGCADGNIVIPEEVDGVKVVGIQENAFKNNKILTSLSLPSTIKYINSNAFENCENLTTINLDENITFIGSAAFKGCVALTSVALNSKIENLKDETFAGCVNLKNITLNSIIKNINEKAFENCKSLVQIVLPETLSSVDVNAFKNCIRLVEVYDLKNAFSTSYPSSVISVKTSLSEDSAIEVYGEYECVRGNDNTLYMFRFTPSNQEKFVMPKTLNNEDYILQPYSLTEIKRFTDITISNISQASFKDLIDDKSGAFSISMEVSHLTLDIDKEIPSQYFVDCFEGIKKVTIKNLITEGAVEADYLEEIEMPILFGELRKVFATLAVPHTLKKVTFTGGESVPQNYCKNLEQLTEVTLPNSLLTIGQSAFSGCENLEDITFSNKLTTIGESAFYACYALKELDLPDSLQVIDSYAFKYCSAIERVVIPQNVTTINSYAFDICSSISAVYNLSSLDIVARTYTHGGVAENVYYVYTSLDEENKIFVEGDYVFVLQKDNNYHLVAYNGEDESLTLPEKYNGENYILDARVFKDCINLKSLTLPSTITELPDEAFKDVSCLESVVVGTGVISIGNNAFSGCVHLKNITLNSNLKSIGENAFLDCGVDASGDKTVYYNGDILSWAELGFINEKSTPMSFANCILFNVDGEYESVKEISLPNTMTKINAYQFYGFKDVTTLTVPNSVKTIGQKAFYNVTNVKQAEIPAINGVFSSLIESVVINTNVTNNFFTNWNKLKTVVVKEGVTSVGDGAFSGCAVLESVSLPESLSSVGESVFINSPLLTTLIVDSNNETYLALEQGFGLVEKKTSTLLFGNETSIIPEGIVHIAPYAFYNNKNVRAMTIPSSVQTIGDYAFYNCYGMNDITFSNNIVSIGDYAFYNFFNLKKLDFSASTKLTSIGARAFMNCEDLEVLSLPSSLQSVGESAFDKDCKQLTTVSMPAISDYFAYMFGGAAYIPSNIKSVTIISGDIPASYFSGCSGLTSITIQGATSIDEKAFYYCKALTTLSLPNTLKSIGSMALSNCIAIENISLPSGLEEIGSNAFDNCKKLKSIVIPKSVKKLNTYTFNECDALESITFEGGTEINEICKCFVYGCDALKELVIPAGVTTLWRDALYGCYSVESLTIPKLEFYDTYTTGLKLAELFGTTVPSTLKNVTILSATSIPAEAFYNCSNILSITFPDSITSIGKNAFYNCSSLSYNNIYGGKYLATATNNYFCLMEVSDSELTSFEVHADCKLIYSDVFSGKTMLEVVSLPEGLISIGESAFYNCSSLTEITLPSTLKEIGNLAFKSTNLASVTLSKSLQSVGESAFSGLTTLTSLSFAPSCEVESIGKEAFKNCTGLTSVDFTNAACLKSIGQSCFMGCTNIASVTFSNSIEEIKDSAFRGLTKVTSLALPTSLVSIGAYAFYETGAQTITLPSTLQLLGDYSFYHSSNLTTLTFADNCKLTKIGAFAFVSSRLLNTVTFGENVALTEIGESAFSFCTALTTITLPKSLKVIGESAFANCNTLATVLFESGSELTTLKDLAFDGCVKLNEIHLARSVTTIGLAFTWVYTEFTIYYGGSVSNWKNISISKGQNAAYQIAWLTNANIIYNS